MKFEKMKKGGRRRIEILEVIGLDILNPKFMDGSRRWSFEDDINLELVIREGVNVVDKMANKKDGEVGSR